MLHRISKGLNGPISFRTKLILTSILCILLPALITLSMYNTLTKAAVKEEAVLQSEQRLELIDGYLTNLFDYMLYTANNIHMDAGTNALLKAISSGKSYEGPNAEYERFNDRQSITTKLDNMKLLGDKLYVTILLKNGDSFDNYGKDEYDAKLFWEEPWVAKLKDLSGLQSLWIETTPTVFFSEQSTSPYQLSIARTLRGQSVNPYGYVIVTILETQISDIFKRVSKGQETMLLDGDNRILSHADSGRIGEPFPYLEEGARQKHSSIVVIGDESYILSAHSLSLSGWKLVSLTPYKAAVSKLNSIFSNVSLFQLASFLVFLLLFVYLIGTYTRPLVRLGRVAEKVQRGNLEIRSGIRGGDEIGYLGHSFDQMLDQVKAMIAEITMTQARKREAELAMLQAQINPHFLFNVLNSIRMKVMRGGDLESADMISSLSKLLRMTISEEKGAIPLHEEVDTVVDYVKLMNMRQKEQLELKLELAAETLLLPVPRFCLQPIIENAIIHGLSQKHGTITIRSLIEDQYAVVSVLDDGMGMNEAQVGMLMGKLERTGQAKEGAGRAGAGFSGIGLVNVYERLKMTYGLQVKLEVSSEPEHGTEVTLYIPKQAVIEDV